MKVTAQDLLRGMWSAMQSCGEGLQASAVLFQSKQYSRSVALCMAARDEFGKSRLLRDLWKRAEGGGTVTFDEVLAVCGKAPKGSPQVTHLKKQEAAQGSVVLRGEPGSPLDAAIWRDMKAGQAVSLLRQQGVSVDDPRLVAAYDEWDASRAEMARLIEATKQRVPGERVELRNRALYVDPEIDGGRIHWRRPNEVGHDEARDALMDAIGDYIGLKQNLQPPFVGMPDVGGSPALEAALAAWTDKPVLPEASEAPFQTVK